MKIKKIASAALVLAALSGAVFAQAGLPGFEQCMFKSYVLPIGRTTFEAGNKVFAENCASCHGVNPAAADLSNPSSWKYGSEPRNVYRTVMFGIPGKKHAFAQNADGKLTEMDAWNVTASVLAKSCPPQGVTLPSGLQYAILRRGTGAAANFGNTVTAHYTGWLTNGNIFDSSYPRRKPFSFRLGAGQVIRGWDEGVHGMQVGELRQLLVPANLGYGARSAGAIPPNSTLIFQVELVGIN